MHSILLIAAGPEASVVTEAALREERVVVTRTSLGSDAHFLLNSAPFDAIVCAIDDLDAVSRDCIDVIEQAHEVPTVIVVRTEELPLRSFAINRRIVSAERGLQEVKTALRQQFRRVSPGERESTPKDTEFEFTFKFKAEPGRIGKARAVAGGFIQRCMRIDDHELTRLELVLDEALANAVYHGSLEVCPQTWSQAKPTELKQMLAKRLDEQPYSDRQVCVGLCVTQSELRITVTDEGPGFEIARTAAVDDDEAVHRKSGRGLLLMQAFADSVEFNETGNSVTLVRTRDIKTCSSTDVNEPAAAAAMAE